MDAEIVLFDLDGVLVRSGGYRAAVQNCMEYLEDRAGVQIPHQTSDAITLFESIGISSEWDMIPISLAITLNAAGEKLGRSLPAMGLPEILDWVRAQNPGEIAVDYASILRKVNQAAEIGLSPSPSRSLYDSIRYGELVSLLPYLDQQPFVHDLLMITRDPTASFTFRLVQNFILGDQVFTETYGIPAEVKGSSLLLNFDQPALDPFLGERLLDLRSRGLIHPCAYTLRPSLPPVEEEKYPRGFSPEAEMALDLVGLSDLPMIGYGSLQWLGRRHQADPDLMTKPAVVQPLAAIAAGWTGNIAESLEWAYHVAGKGCCNWEEAAGGILPGEFRLHVFEDTAGGISAVCKAVDILQRAGFKIESHAWGISSNPEKEAALSAAGARLFPDVNRAFREAFGELR